MTGKNTIMAVHHLSDSSQTYEDISENLECCLICLDPYDKPTQLICDHTFCEQCLCHYLKIYGQNQGQEDGVSVPCPICAKHTLLPPNGVAGLNHSCSVHKDQLSTPMAQQRCDSCFYYSKAEEAEYYCNKCFLNFCQACKNAHQTQAVFSSHAVIHISNKDSIRLFCVLHGRLPSVYFCNDCNIPTCSVCVIQLHNKHTNTRLSEALSVRRDNLKHSLNKLGPKLEKLAVKLRKVSHDFTTHKDCLMGTDTSLNSMCSMNNGQTESLQMKVRKDSNDNVESEIRVIEREIKKLQMLYDMVTKSLEMSQSKKILVVYDTLMSRLQTVTDYELEQLQQDIAVKIERELEGSNQVNGNHTISSSLSFSSLHDRRSMSVTGTSTKSSPDPSQLSFQGGTLEDETDHFMLFKPKLIWKIEKTRPEELWNPTGIAFHPSGYLVVAEYDVMTEKNNRLRLYDSSGRLKNMIGSGHLKPLGLAVNRDGNIAACDCAGKRVKIFSPEGHMHSEFGKGNFGWPFGLACNSKGEYIISDTFHDTISIYSRDGRKIKTFGSSGSGSTQFRNPFYVTVDASDNIVISDYGNKCMKVFDIRGEFMNVYLSDSQRRQSTEGGKPNKKRGKLKGPRGIAVDIKDNTIVADDSGKVCLFDPKGTYARNLLTDEDTVKYPEAIATNRYGRLAVTEWNTNNMFSIKVFHMYEWKLHIYANTLVSW